MADLKQFAEQLVNLTVKEVNELATILKDEYGIEPAAAAVVVAAGGGDAGAAADELERLRDELARAGASAPGASASAPAGTDAGTNVVNQLFGACAQTLVGLAREADGLEARLVGLQTYVSQVCLKPP